MYQLVEYSEPHSTSYYQLLPASWYQLSTQRPKNTIDVILFKAKCEAFTSSLVGWQLPVDAVIGIQPFYYYSFIIFSCRAKQTGKHKVKETRADKTMPSDRKRGDSASSTSSTGEGSPKTKGGGERLIASGRRTTTVGTAFVNGDHTVSSLLVSHVTHKACQFSMIFEDGGDGLCVYFGQGGLIRSAKIASTPDVHKVRNARIQKRRRVSFSQYASYVAKPVTAKHNLELSDEDREYKRTTIKFVDGPEKEVAMPDGGCTLGDLIQVRAATENTLALEWEDNDVAFGNVVDREGSSLTKMPRLFRKAPGGFQLRVGHKIGMAVYRTFDITHDDAHAPLNVDLEAVYGQKHQVGIYTGTVTEISDNGKTFCHSINSFAGCSGAVIFLLDEDQDQDIGEELPLNLFEGVAVGIQVGGLDQNNNIAFLI